MSEKVYFIPLADGVSVKEQKKAIRKLADEMMLKNIIGENDFVAIKTHIGEKNNVTYVDPKLIRELVRISKECSGQPFMTETSTLYKGERENAIKHIMLAEKHGFGINEIEAPFILADGLIGNTECEVEIDGEFNKTVKIAREIENADVLLVVSHPTGHIIAGIGACIKNLGMGFASRMGKLRQHASMKPFIKEKKCRFCGKCIKWCPEKAIIGESKKAKIVAEKCIGCGECIAVCRYDAVSYDWGAESDNVQKNMAEYAYGTVKNKLGKCAYFNVLVSMTAECDCMGEAQKKIINDIGILASYDPVAIDKATLDLTMKANAGKSLAEIAHPHLMAQVQLQHAENTGLGSMQYELVTLD